MKQKTDPKFKPVFEPAPKIEPILEPVEAPKPEIKPEPKVETASPTKQCMVCKAFDSDDAALLLDHMNLHTHSLNLGQLIRAAIDGQGFTILTSKS